MIVETVKTPSTKSTLSTVTTVSPSTELYPAFSANAALVLLAVACSLLDRQVERLIDFENEGGFTGGCIGCGVKNEKAAK